MLFRFAVYSGILLCLVGGGFVTPAAAQHFNVQKYTVNDGLADSYVLTVCEDSQGFLWLGTINGLSRFDGKEFINYGYAEGLPNLWVGNIYEDHNKRLWASTRKGIVEIRGQKCISYPVDDGETNLYVFHIKESVNHRLWAFTNKGLYQFDANQWKKVKLYPGLENYHCRDILETGNGRIINYGNYLVTQDSTGRYHMVGKYPLDEPYFNELQRFHNKVYLTLPDQILLLQPRDTLSLFRHALQKRKLAGVFCDSQNRFWIRTYDGGLMISKKGSTEIITDTIPVTENLVSGIYEDRHRNIWVCCLDGLLRVREVNYKTFTAAQTPWLYQVNNLVRNTDSTFIVCTERGLLQYKNENFSPLPLTYVPATARTPFNANPTDSWCRDNNNRIWLVKREKKLFLLEHHVLKDVSALAPARRSYYWRIAYNKFNNKVYLNRDTLLCGDSHNLHTFKDADKGQCLTKVREIFAFSNGKMLVIINGNKFLLLDARHHIQDISTGIGIRQSNEEFSFLEEPSRKFWLAYNGGLVKYHWNKQLLPEKELQLTTQQGLPNNSIHAITQDAYNRVWAVTSSGLVVIETSTTAAGNAVIHPLSEEAGITGNQWLQSRLLTDASGYIWLSFSNRLYRFDPRLIQFDRTPPPVTIEDIQLNLQPTQWNAFSDSLFGYRQLPHAVVLPYYLNNLTISYRAPCFNGISGLDYSYQLAGASNNWSAGTKNNFVSFIKLPPGTYHFKVRARKSNTVWSDPAVFTFVIKKPYWETWAFQLAIAALATIILAFLFRHRVRQIKRKVEIGQQMRELELKALRSQMNPHFIYNALNSIQALVLDNQTDKASQYISKFGRLLRQVLNCSDHNSISLAHELQALELYIQLEQLRLNVPLQYHIMPDPAILPAEESIPPLVLQPFVENALWHGLSPKQGEKILTITLHIDNDWLIVVITDNGIGRQQAAAHKTLKTSDPSKGMDITGRRIKEYNQLPEIDAVDIIDLRNSLQQPCGTQIILHIKRKKQLPA